MTSPSNPATTGTFVAAIALSFIAGFGTRHCMSETPDPTPEAEIGASLGAADLTAVIRRKRAALQFCYESALRSSSSKEPIAVEVNLHIEPNGKVTSATMEGTALPGMQACIERQAMLWRFPTAHEPTRTTVPLRFDPGE